MKSFSFLVDLNTSIQLIWFETNVPTVPVPDILTTVPGLGVFSPSVSVSLSDSQQDRPADSVLSTSVSPQRFDSVWDNMVNH